LGAASVAASPTSVQEESSQATLVPPRRILGAAPNRFSMQARFGPRQAVWILTKPRPTFQEELASRELARGLSKLGLVRPPIQAVMAAAEPRPQDAVFSLQVDREAFKHPEAYEIAREGENNEATLIRLKGATPQALLYAVFDFLERQGAFFALSGDIYPLDPATTLNVPPAGRPWRGQPRFGVRGLMVTPTYLNGIVAWNREDYRAYFEAMLRMRFNTLSIFVFWGSPPWPQLFCSSYLNFTYGGTGHSVQNETSATYILNYMPQRTSDYGMGAGDLYDGDVFGAEATLQARNVFEAGNLAEDLWREAFGYANKLGIRVGIGFEIDRIPVEIVQAAPPESYYVPTDPKIPGPTLDPESAANRDILEARLGSVLETYPMLDHIWLWEYELQSWTSRIMEVPLSVIPFKQAADFLRRHAPEKRLVFMGWGGVTRHFASFHKQLPQDVVFSALTDTIGLDPVSEEFAKLESRERWPIPWLEDDSAMWSPQVHVHQLVRDIDLAEKYGCQGLFGLHWRDRIMDVNANFQSRYSWDRDLSAAEYFRTFGALQTREPRGRQLAELLDAIERDHLILCTEKDDSLPGLYKFTRYSGDYHDVFVPGLGFEPSEKMKKSQMEVVRQLHALTAAASSPEERERLNYLTAYVETFVPYAESWSVGAQLHKVLERAAKLKKDGQTEAARQLVLAEGVLLWLKMAPLVRETLLVYQNIVSTRSDLGQLVSMHNKYERIALYRYKASIKEYLKELPPEMEKAFTEARLPDPKVTPRVFIPTLPTLLDEGGRLRISAVVVGGEKVLRATLFTRLAGAVRWTGRPMKLLGRRTYQCELQKPAVAGLWLDYYVQAEVEGREGRIQLTVPVEAPTRTYTVTLI
jgi:hypothetical protein